MCVCVFVGVGWGGGGGGGARTRGEHQVPTTKSITSDWLPFSLPPVAWREIRAERVSSGLWHSRLVEHGGGMCEKLVR